MNPIQVLVWSLAAATLLPGCAATNTPITSDYSTLVWPQEPAKARIRYLYEIKNPADLDIGTGFFSRMKSLLSGAESQEINKPYGIAVAASGEIFIVDSAHAVIHYFDSKKRRYRKLPDKAVANFSNPIGIAIGRNNRVFVSDSSSGLIHVFDQTTLNFVTSFGAEVLIRPTGIAVHHESGDLLVTDTKQSKLLVFDQRTNELKRSLGGTDSKPGSGTDFSFPTNVAVARNGDIYVSDSLNFRVQRFNSSLEKIGEFGSPGNAPGTFSRPKGLATDSDGHVYVIDALFDNVQIFEPNGDLLLALGGPGSGPGRFWLPNAIFIDEHDRIYVSDSYNGRIQVFQYLGGEESAR